MRKMIYYLSYIIILLPYVMNIIKVEQKPLFDFLRDQQAPLMEIELIRRFTVCQEDKREDRLFMQHFSLYHALYGLKQFAGGKGYHLHLDPMRIRMVKLPDHGLCRHYIPEEGVFCPMETGHGLFCDYHARMYANLDGMLYYDPLQEFYGNPDNIRFGNSRILQKLLKGMKVYVIRKGEIDRALRLFDISHPGKAIIQKRYHELAKRFHPDSSSGSEAMMKTLNHAYYILREVYIL
ncbi:MAG: hypothetical protein CVV44_02355 [Spirochaetae bacterium HGW-Spirochaetae-1]|nr:MAG: hypothetical protein CVV44_02355 [Spirochaetae bacterium HGW-Spirochaetae-1]